MFGRGPETRRNQHHGAGGAFINLGEATVAFCDITEGWLPVDGALEPTGEERQRGTGRTSLTPRGTNHCRICRKWDLSLGPPLSDTVLERTGGKVASRGGGAAGSSLSPRAPRRRQRGAVH